MELTLTPSPRMLAAARNLVGLTQEQLSAEAGVNANTIKKLEGANANPTASTLDKVIRAFRRLGVEFFSEGDGACEGLRWRQAAGR